MTSLPDSLTGEQFQGTHLESLSPNHVFPLSWLHQVPQPEIPSHFDAFWERRYQRTLDFQPKPLAIPSSIRLPGVHVFDIQFETSDRLTIRGWLTLPINGGVHCGLVVGHGYGGREAPEHLPTLSNAAILYPCFRGLARSLAPPISPDPQWHVLHDIDRPDRYVIGGCVEDLWTAISALLQLFPEVTGRIGFVGTSFSGGIGCLALAREQRVARAHLAVPTFGHHLLRLRLPTWGSGSAVQRVWREGRLRLAPTLALHDAACAARSIQIPVQCVCALSDPMVTPPGQFAIYNALPHPKELIVVQRGHADSELSPDETARISSERSRFLSVISHS